MQQYFRAFRKHAAPRLPLLTAVGMLVCWVAVGCGESYLYKKAVIIEGATWHYEDTVRFDFDIADTTLLYSIGLEVVHAQDFPFQNMYVQFHTRYPSGEVKKQLVSLELAAKGAFWLGDCSGSWCSLTIPIQEKAFFNERGQYTLLLEQYLRQSPVKGVKEFALRIKPCGKRVG